MQFMICELRVRSGVDLNDRALTLLKLCDGIELLYGDEIAEMIIEDIILKVEKIAEEQMGKK